MNNYKATKITIGDDTYEFEGTKDYNELENKPDLTIYAEKENTYTKDEVDTAIREAETTIELAIEEKVDTTTYNDKIDEIEAVLDGKADKVNTYTKEEVDRLIAGAGTGVSKEYVDGEISRVEGEIPSLEGYATEQWVEDKGYLTEHQPLDDYVTKDEYNVKMEAVDNAIATKADAEETANRFSSVDEYLEQLHTEIEGKADTGSVPTKTSELTNDSGFLTEHQQLKTINGESIVGEGDITIQGGSDNKFYNLNIMSQDECKALYDELVVIFGTSNLAKYKITYTYTLKQTTFFLYCNGKANTSIVLNGIQASSTGSIGQLIVTLYNDGSLNVYYNDNYLAQQSSIDNLESDMLNKADKSTTYTKTETDNVIQGTKTALEGEINTKVDTTTYEGKISEIEEVLGTKADRTEIPSLAGYATESYVRDYTDTVKQGLQSDIDQKLNKDEYDVKMQSIDVSLAGKVEHNEFINRCESIEQSYLPLSGGNLTGNLTIGSTTETAYKKFEAIRNTSGETNGAAFYVNSDGTAAFYHKSYNGSSATNDAILKFDSNGLQYAKSGSRTATASVFKNVLVEGDLQTETWTFELEDGSTITKEIYLK